MTAVLPISAEPAAIPKEDAQRGRWRRMPAKAKAGAVLLGLFLLAAIIGPEDSALASGSSATGDYERLNSPQVNAMLAALAGAETTTQQTAALEPIAKYVAANLPVIPTTTGSQWFEYNSQNYTGWPTQDNPYETGQPSGTNNGSGSGSDEVVILHLIPRG